MASQKLFILFDIITRNMESKKSFRSNSDITLPDLIRQPLNVEVRLDKP